MKHYGIPKTDEWKAIFEKIDESGGGSGGSVVYQEGVGNPMESSVQEAEDLVSNNPNTFVIWKNIGPSSKSGPGDYYFAATDSDGNYPEFNQFKPDITFDMVDLDVLRGTFTTVQLPTNASQDQVLYYGGSTDITTFGLGNLGGSRYIKRTVISTGNGKITLGGALTLPPGKTNTISNAGIVTIISYNVNGGTDKRGHIVSGDLDNI